MLHSFMVVHFVASEKMGFPNLEVPFWGVPIIRIIVCWGFILGSPNVEDHQKARHCRRISVCFLASLLHRAQARPQHAMHTFATAPTRWQSIIGAI